MYDVSDLYKTKIKENTRETKIYGTLTLNDEDKTIIDITGADTVSGSVVIDNACVNSNDYELGAVYMGQLKLSLFTDINRYSLYGGTIDLRFGLKINDTDYEEVPLGIYTISEATRTGTTISIIAYDNMNKLDGTFYGVTGGTPWELLNHISKVCGVGIENTEDEINSFSPLYETGNPIVLRIPSENGYSTFRDLLADIAITLGGFATISRNGKIWIKRFGTQKYNTEVLESEAVIELESKHLKSRTVADYTCEYTGVKATINETEYSAGEDGNVLVLTNELWNTGLDEQKQAIIDNIYNEVKDDYYIPAEIEYDGDPSIDLGDKIKIPQGDGTYNTFVMTNNWQYSGTQKITAVGKNILLETVESSTDKKINSLSNSITDGGFRNINYVGIKDVTIGSTKTRLANVDVYIKQATIGVLHGQAVIDVTTAGTFQIFYELNEEELSWKPVEDLTEGKHIINFYCALPLTLTSDENVINVYYKSDDGAGTINADDINICVYGSFAYTSSDQYTGLIKFTETMDEVEIAQMLSYTFEEEFTKDI